MPSGGLTTDERKRYDARQREHMRPLVAFGLCSGAFLFGADFARELISGTIVGGPTLLTRAVCALSLLALAPLAQLTPFRRRPELILYAGVATSATAVSLIATYLPVGFQYATGALLLMILVISALAPSLKAALLSSLLLFAAFGLVSYSRGLGGGFVDTVAVFVATGAVIGCVMSEVRSRIRQRVFGLECELERVVRTDALSGLLSRRAFLDASTIEFQRAQRYAYPVAVLMIDIDHFKLLNDAHGHAAGDEAIRMLGDTCRGLLRQSDLVGRMGGEEFAVVLPHTEIFAAVPLANRLREAIGQAQVTANGIQINFTISVGVAMRQLGNEPVLDTLSRADRAMYDAKHAGRNRVMPARAA